MREEVERCEGVRGVREEVQRSEGGGREVCGRR